MGFKKGDMVRSVRDTGTDISIGEVFELIDDERDREVFFTDKKGIRRHRLASQYEKVEEGNLWICGNASKCKYTPCPHGVSHYCYYPSKCMNPDGVEDSLCIPCAADEKMEATKMGFKKGDMVRSVRDTDIDISIGEIFELTNDQIGDTICFVDKGGCPRSRLAKDYDKVEDAELWICPKAGECKNKCNHHKKHVKIKEGECELANSCCPACIPYTPEEKIEKGVKPMEVIEVGNEVEFLKEQDTCCIALICSHGSTIHLLNYAFDGDMTEDTTVSDVIRITHRELLRIGWGKEKDIKIIED